jgi:hypothetical protein
MGNLLRMQMGTDHDAVKVVANFLDCESSITVATLIGESISFGITSLHGEPCIKA